MPWTPETNEVLLKTFAHEPIGLTLNNGKWPIPKYKYSIAACARWETSNIVEWLLYHRSIGIEHVYLFCNDDTPDELYEAIMPFVLGTSPFVTFRYFDFPGLQYQMYMQFLRHFLHETSWFIFLDCDEFIFTEEKNSIPDFMSRFEDGVEAVYFNWLHFGSNGHQARPPGSVLKNYTKREIGVSAFTKLFIKRESVPYAGIFSDSFAIHHNVLRHRRDTRAVNVLGESVTEYYDDFPHKAWNFLTQGDRRDQITQTAFIGHFNIRSEQDFELKVQRGTLGDFRDEKMWGEKDQRDREAHHASTNVVEDNRLHDYWIELCHGGRRSAVFPERKWALISEGAIARQSSTAHLDGTADQDAARALSRTLLGRPQNHTLLEEEPWWSVDLGGECRVHEIRIYNRIEVALERMARMRIESSLDNENWNLQLDKNDGVLFGGADGNPFQLVDASGIVARWIRIVVPGMSYLHMDQVEVFGIRSAAT